MGRRLLVVALACGLAVAAAGCGGDGADPFPTALPAAESFDHEVLAQALLREDDLQEGFTLESYVVPTEEGGVLADAQADNETIRVQSSVIWMPTVADAEDNLARQRNAWIAFGWDEVNLELEGTQAAFLYTKPGTSGQVAVGIEEQFTFALQLFAVDLNEQVAEALDAEEFRRLYSLVAERVVSISDGELAPVDGTPVAASTTAPSDQEATP